MPTKRKAAPVTPIVVVSSWDRWKVFAELAGIVVRAVDQPEFIKFLERAAELGRPPESAVDGFIGARAAMAGLYVGRQKAAAYLADRSRGFTAARHAVLRVDTD